MRIGIKILNFVLATILLTSAALHQEKADVFEFDLVLGVQTEEVGPGDYIECSPVFEDIGGVVAYCDFYFDPKSMKANRFLACKMGRTGRMGNPECMP